MPITPPPPPGIPPVVPPMVPMGTVEVIPAPPSTKVEAFEAATIMDTKILPMGGFCSSHMNPGYIKPIPPNPPALPSGVPGIYPACAPTVAAPWVAGAKTVLIGSIPALNITSSCMCTVGMGTIKVMPIPKASHAATIKVPP